MLDRLDYILYKYLNKHVGKLPKRVSKFVANFYTDSRIRKLYWKELGIEMSEGTHVNLGLTTTATKETPIIIGKNVSIGPNVTLISESEPNSSPELLNISYIKEHCVHHESIVIEDEVWIGASVTILPGVTIGNHSVIGAGSVVLYDVEPYSIYAGVPARKIRELTKS